MMVHLQRTDLKQNPKKWPTTLFTRKKTQALGKVVVISSIQCSCIQ